MAMRMNRGHENDFGWAGQEPRKEGWTDLLRTATEGVVSALSNLYESYAARGVPVDRVKIAELTTAIARLIQLQEGINHKLSKQLLEATSAFKNADRRIAALEHILKEDSIALSRSPERHRSSLPPRARPNASPPECASHPSGAHIAQAAREGLDDSLKNRNLHNTTSTKKVRAKSSKRTTGESGPEKNAKTVENDNQAINEDNSVRIVNEREGVDATTLRPVKRKRLCTSEKVIYHGSNTRAVTTPVPVFEDGDERARRATLPSAVVNLPELPTLRDVEAEIEESEKRRREISQRPKPPACDKCRVRKRADMLRQRGYIDERVFERWAVKPGSCLGYMHMDEPGAPPSPLSFPETPTCSPSEAT